MSKRIKLLDSQGRTFKILGGDNPSVNPYNGCRYNCYNGGCWAEIRARKHPEWNGYKTGFKPNFVESRLTSEHTKKTIRNSNYVWIGIMGDFTFQSPKNIYKVIDKVIKPNAETMFILSSKDPSSFEKFIADFPKNVFLTTSIETNRDRMYKKGNFSKAPGPRKRFKDFKKLAWSRKYLSLEPYMNFDKDEFVDWIKDINPEIVSIGPDSKNNNLPEPSTKKALDLLKELSEFTRVEPKKHFVHRMRRDLPQYKYSSNNDIYADLKNAGYLPSTKFIQPKKKLVQTTI